MFWRIGITLLNFLCVSPVLAHEPIMLDARRATPGLYLELRELPRTSSLNTPTYRVHAFGFPRGRKFNVWTKDFGHSFHELAFGFQVDGAGNLVSSEKSTIDQPPLPKAETFTPGPYPSGAIWEIALVSEDRTLKAFAKVIPYPITARDGTCIVSLELVSQRGERFLASGTGFAPGEEVFTESLYSGRLEQVRRQISADGMLPKHVILHAATGTDRTARYIVRGRSCNVAVNYEWGESALVRR
jgi:hypothetical protein